MRSARKAVWAFAAALAIGSSTMPAIAAQPDSVSFRLEGCKNDGSIVLPNAGGDFICPDTAYTTGNLGKGWNELDLVPHRLTADAGNAAPASQTYTVAVVLDREDDGAPGYDVLSAPVLNTSLSHASCSAASVGPQLSLSPGLGGIDTSIYRLVTITQAKQTVCVYDYYGRLALGSHLFPGSSLHANLGNETLGTAGVGSKEVSIPVKEISPQELDKTMTAVQDADHHWTLAKGSAPSTVSFGNVCDASTPLSKEVTFTVTWTKLAATPGSISVVTQVYATNPAARTITVDVVDRIYRGTDQADLLDTATTPAGGVDVPANTANFLVLTHSLTIPTTQDYIGTHLNDVATATYTDKATGIAVPGQTTAVADTLIGSGVVIDSSAAIRDSESMTGSQLTFSVAQPTMGSFNNYTAGTPTQGPVQWGSGLVNASGSVDFVKTITLGGQYVTSGSITDSARLLQIDSQTFATAGPVTVNISSSAAAKLTISKDIPAFLDAGEKVEITFHVSRLGDAGYSVDKTLTFVAGVTSQSTELTGLVPDTYVVDETTRWFYPAGCNDASCRIAVPLVPVGGTQKTVDLLVDANGVPTCAGTAAFVNVVPTISFATAQVQKRTNPALATDDPDYQWTFKLYDPGGVEIASAVADANAGYVDFGSPPVPLTAEGKYTVVETTKAGWDLDGAVPNDGVDPKVCTFTVDYFDDVGKTFQCTFRNIERGTAQVVKTVTGSAPAGDQAFTFQLRQGASTTSNGTTLETRTADAGNGGTVSFTTLLKAGNTVYQLCEIVMPGWMTTLGTFVPDSFMPPDGVAANPNVDNSILCVNFTVAPGETRTFTVDNSPPPGGRGLTIGFWKNWASCSKSGGKQAPVLDRTLAAATPPGIPVGMVLGKVAVGYLVGDPANPDVAPDCANAVNLLNKSTFGGKKMASDPLFNMAAQLVAAELNLASGAYTCGNIVTKVAQANALLSKYGFNGNTYASKLTAVDATLANSLAKFLDDYNNNRPNVCP